MHERNSPLGDYRGRIRPGDGVIFVRSLGVAGLIAGIVGAGLPIGVASTIGMQALVGRFDDGGQVTGTGVRRGQEPVPR